LSQLMLDAVFNILYGCPDGRIRGADLGQELRMRGFPAIAGGLQNLCRRDGQLLVTTYGNGIWTVELYVPAAVQCRYYRMPGGCIRGKRCKYAHTYT
jgi:hypothetical protein